MGSHLHVLGSLPRGKVIFLQLFFIPAFLFENDLRMTWLVSAHQRGCLVFYSETRSLGKLTDCFDITFGD